MHGVASDIAPRRSPYGASTAPTPTRADTFELIQLDDGESLEALTRAQPRLALDRITDNGTDEKEALVFAGVQYAPPPEVVFRNAFDEALPGFLCFGFGMGEVACRCGGTLRIRLGDDLHAVAKRNGKTRAAYVLHRAAALASVVSTYRAAPGARDARKSDSSSRPLMRLRSPPRTSKAAEQLAGAYGVRLRR